MPRNENHDNTSHKFEKTLLNDQSISNDRSFSNHQSNNESTSPSNVDINDQPTSQLSSKPYFGGRGAPLIHTTQ